MKKQRKNLAIICLLGAAFLVTCGIDACRRGYTISGTVDGDVLAGITMVLSGDDNATVTTAVDGSYRFAGLPPGDYTLTPGMTGYIFEPQSREVTLSEWDIGYQDFTAVTFRDTGDLDTIDSIADNMVTLGGGSFRMGCSSGDSDCRENESPTHMVTVSSFAIGRYEVTQGQWEAVMGSLPADIAQQAYGQGDNFPIYHVTWNEAQTFIDALNTLTGSYNRPPTEAEWEYAVRAGTTTRYYCGDDAACLEDIGWYSSNAGGRRHLVGQKTPNAWNLYDMSGNVSEWVQDYMGTYPSDNQTDPTGPISGSSRVLRGGNWYNDAVCSRSTYRHMRQPDDTYWFLGFRLARTLER